MNYGISILFRAIPLLMALFCFGYGTFVLGMGTDPARYVAGPVVLSLGMICIALFATAATIIRQIIHTYSTVAKYALPILGYLAALLTFIYGWEYMGEAPTASHFVAGHVVCGVAFITACVATTATSSTHFTLIPANSDTTGHDTPPQAFNAAQGRLLIAVAALLALATWIWTCWLLAKSDVHSAYYVAGHVMAGISCICTSLVALVATIVRQIRNSYSHAERKWWPITVLAMGTLSILWGLLIMTNPIPAKSSIGYIMIGLGLVCYSISSKVILLAAIWRNTFKLANRIPLIPVLTALACLFLSAFLFEMAGIHEVYFVPARVLAGLGGICFTLFSIVSILESGTSKG
ncbi:DUF2776 family protein [Bacteroides gallinarum]|uniref:DUF2776 family protein n=1 Tax=Bacteroides gallinarum TaxID=376806 RepID=UPI00046979C4|nr:DUF2776 family protein [Bacteroides gallinarum]